MILSELASKIPGAKLVGKGDVEVNRPRYDNRLVSPGDLFCAIVGEQVDGNRFAQAAVAEGAAAVLTSNSGLEVDVPKLIVQDDRMGMAFASHALYDDPTARLELVGITGTNGKTTGTHILQSIFRAHGGRAARIGTIGWEFEGQGEPLSRTTPEAPDLLEMIAALRSWGATDVVMEVTSIALTLKRVAGFSFAAGLFTNLSQDHLDLHGSMEAYFAAKKLFFNMLPTDAPAVANVDDPYGIRILKDIKAKPIGFGFEGTPDVKAEILEESAQGLKLGVSGLFGSLELNAPYVGRFNAENVLGCAATALALGVPAGTVARGVAEAPQVRGRMERLVLEGGVTAIVDYAHTPDALMRALQALRPMTAGKLIVVVGAGGDRDRTKRPIMGKLASEHADYAIYTSDNPRTEDPDAIVREVAAGAVDKEFEVVVNRREAIEAALAHAGEGDVVLIAGKGHETYQEVNGVRHHFDDREEVLKLRSAV